MGISEQIDAALKAQKTYPEATCSCCRPKPPTRPHFPVPQGEDEEGDRAYAYWERKLTAGFKGKHADLTFEEKRAMFKKFPKKKKNWRGGGHAP